MKILLVVPHYPPLMTSAAVMLRDLARELASSGHHVTVFTPDASIDARTRCDVVDGIDVLRIKVPKIMDMGLVRQAFGEAFLPFAMLHGIIRSPFRFEKWDGIVWYSPSIFLAITVAVLRRRCSAPTYLVLRDCMSEILVDLQIIRRGVFYLLVRFVGAFQYRVADKIGVQAASHISSLTKCRVAPEKLEVLNNWIRPSKVRTSTIEIAKTGLLGRRIFVYIGNIGLAQGVDFFLNTAERLIARRDIGFLFVGRGGEFQRISREAAVRRLSNVLFHPEIHPDEIPSLFAQCHVGLVSLDPRHTTTNIPGKFMTYVQYGLPVLARVNRSNELVGLIEQSAVGKAYCGDSLDEFCSMALELIEDEAGRAAMFAQGQGLIKRLFSAQMAVNQIVDGLQVKSTDRPVTVS